MSVVVLGAVSGAATVGVAARGGHQDRGDADREEGGPKPVGSPTGTGSFTGTISAKRVLRWKLTFKGLTGPTAGAHIHLGKPGKTGPVAVVLCNNVCKSPKSGTATLTPAQLKAIRSGGAYVNVHTTKNPNGEIRGQIAVTSRHRWDSPCGWPESPTSGGDPVGQARGVDARAGGSRLLARI